MISDQSKKLLWKWINFVNCLNLGSETRFYLLLMTFADKPLNLGIEASLVKYCPNAS